MFNSCDGAQNITVKDAHCSKEAEHSLSITRKLGTRVEVKRAFAEDALTRAIKKFRGDYGLKEIQYRNHKSGFKQGNPYNESVWDVLEETGIIERHRISNVDEGGLKITEDKEIRREIAKYFDDGVFGSGLTKIIQKIMG